MPRLAKTEMPPNLMQSDLEPDFDSFDTRGPISTNQRAATSTMKVKRGRPPGSSNKVIKSVRKDTLQRAAKVATSSTHALVGTESIASFQNYIDSARVGLSDEDEIAVVEQLDTSVQKVFRPTSGQARPIRYRKDVNPPFSNSGHSDAILKTEPHQNPDTVDEVSQPQNADLTSTHLNLEPGKFTKGRTSSKHSPINQEQEDVSTRHQLAEMSKKYERLEEKYQNLQEIGINVAQRNFERLKKQADENTATANVLITNLKEELAAYSRAALLLDQLRQELDEKTAEAEKLRAALSSVNDALSHAKSDINSLSAKLSASRNMELHANAPGSSSKGQPGSSRTSYADAMQNAQGKENLYSDLTGLIIRGIQHNDREEVFDCIQTGRNGTLHFKLSVENRDSTENYEDAQLSYRPQLDAGRDNAVMEVLPDYLTEEITFPRSQATKFFSRVTRSLAERLE